MFAQNTRCSGRGFVFTPQAKLDDGMFDLVAVKKAGILKTINLFDRVKADGGHVEDPVVCYVQAKSMSLAGGTLNRTLFAHTLVLKLLPSRFDASLGVS